MTGAEKPGRRDKVTDLATAVRRFVTPGCHLSIGGFTVNRNPMAAVHEIIRQGIDGLHLSAHSNGQGLDELIGAGCVRRVEIAYGGSGIFAPTAIRFRKAVETGAVGCEDYSNYQMALRYLAGAMGVPFLPTRSGLGTDLINRWGFSEAERRDDPQLPDRKLVVIDNPFSDPGGAEKVVLVPALTPDVTIIHAQAADPRGNVRIDGLPFADVEQAEAARHLVVTCEALVAPETLRAAPDRNAIPFIHVDAVVPVPIGAYPTACYGAYDYDPVYLKAYAEAARDDDRYAAYLAAHVRELPDHAALLARLGSGRLDRLRADPETGYAVGLDRR